MVGEAIPQREALDLYLAMVAGREREGFFEIRSKRFRGGMSRGWIPLHDHDRAARSLINRGQLNDAYLGAAPRATRGGGLAAIDRVWCLWADCDSIVSVERLAAFRPLPSIVIRSGSDGHAHAYWPLRAAAPPSWAKRANRRLALELGADRNATDAARIMRPPRTLNHKHDPPRRVVCTRLELTVFDLGDVVGRLADDPAYRPSLRCEAPPHACGHSSAAGLVKTVREAVEGNRNAALYWAAIKVAESGLDRQAAREELREAALAAGLPDGEIDRTLDSALDRRPA